MTSNPTNIVLNEVFASRIGRPELVESLRRLVVLAAGVKTGGGRVAAKVVLSCYNSDDYPLDIADLGSLDARHFEDALNVIRLRVEGSEAHKFFVDGDALFNMIADTWGMRPEHYGPIQ